MIHFSRWPLRWAAACGTTGARLTSELDLVTCDGCRSSVLAAELISIPYPLTG